MEAEEMRKLDTARCEEMLMNLQPGIRKGNVAFRGGRHKGDGPQRENQRIRCATQTRIDR